MRRLAAAVLNQLGVEHSRPEPGLDHGRLPDLVGVGTQRSGTSWLFQLLVDAGAVEPPVVRGRTGVKELHAFDRRHPLAESDYARFFLADCPRPTGEWTPAYVRSATALERLGDLPDRTRFLLLLRDPMARARSGLRHEARRHLRLSPQHVEDALERSRYHAQWLSLTRRISPRRILVIQFEKLVAAPGPELSRVLEFVGAEGARAIDHARAPRNASSPMDFPEWVTERLEAARPELREDAARMVGASGDALSADLWTTLDAR